MITIRGSGSERITPSCAVRKLTGRPQPTSTIGPMTIEPGSTGKTCSSVVEDRRRRRDRIGGEHDVVERAGRRCPARSASVSRRCSMPTTPPTAFSVKPKREVDRRQELDRHHDDEREARLEREQPDRLDLDRPEAQLQRAAVAAGALAEEAAAADEPGVEREADPGRRLERRPTSGLLPPIALRRDRCARADPAPSTVALIDAAEVDGDRCCRRRSCPAAPCGQLERDLAQVERAELRPRRQHDARRRRRRRASARCAVSTPSTTSACTEPPAPPSRLAIGPPPTPASMPRQRERRRERRAGAVDPQPRGQLGASRSRAPAERGRATSPGAVSG